MLVAGLGVVAGRRWARAAGVAVAFVSAVVAMVFLPASPVAGMLIIGFDVIAAYALVVHGGETRAAS